MGREEIRAPLKTPAWQANLDPVFKVSILILMKILQTGAKKHKDWYCTD